MENGQAEFDKLLRRYLDGTSSKAERKQLYDLIASGHFDDQIGDDIYNALKSESNYPGSFSEMPRMDRLYEEKIKGEITHASVHVKARQQAFPGTGRRSGWWVMAASVSGAIVAIGLWLFNSGTQKITDVPLLSDQLQAPEQQEPVVRFVDKQLIRLPDGSTVLLNEGAELTYDSRNFGRNNRKVELKGEAFFDIFSDPSKVFIVQSGEVQTTVLGTAFNVKALPGKNEIQVTVARGKVSVGSNLQTYDHLTADQQLTVNTATHTYLKTELKSAIATEWKNDFLILDDVTMGTVAEQLHQKFGVTVHFKNEHLKNCHVTASFLNDENLDHVLQVVSTIHDFSYSYQNDGREIVLDGESVCN